jgi:hypothetical protein
MAKGLKKQKRTIATQLKAQRRKKRVPATVVSLPSLSPPLRARLARAVKQVPFTATPVLHCDAAKLIAGRSDEAALKEHLDEIDKHRLKYEDRLSKIGAQMKVRNFVNVTALAPNKAKVTEALGEYEATMAVLKNYGSGNGDYQLLWGFSAGIGIDQLWYSTTEDTYLIVEAKGPGAQLSTAAAKGDQMSTQWVVSSLNAVAYSSKSSPDDRRHANTMLRSINGKPPPKVIGRVIEALKGGGSRESTSCPDKGIYHGT